MNATPSPAPKVGVVTVNWNGRAWLGDFLTSILAQEYPDYEVVLVDNASRDDSVAFVRAGFPKVHVIVAGRNVGYAAGINLGLDFAAARGADYFLIVNNDTVVAPEALAALVETARAHDRAGFVTGKVYLHDRPDTFHTVGKQADPLVLSGDHLGWMECDVGQYDAEAERAFVDDVMVLVDRRVYDEIGGYDRQFFLNGAEFDYQVRAKARGWRLYYTPRARLWHRVSKSLGGAGNPRVHYVNVRSQMVVLARHTSPAHFARYYLATGLREGNTFLRGLVQLDGAKVRPRLATVLGFLAGTWWLIHRRPMTRVPWIIERLAR